MSTEQLQALLSPIYNSYNSVIKPLIAEIETVERKQPYILFNEIRALHDHLSKCYLTNYSDEDVIKQIKKAEGHLNRLILDCYKFLGVHYYLVYKRFERKYRNVDLRTISNGEFLTQLRRLIYEANQTLKNAKIQQSLNIETSIALFEKSIIGYRNVEELIAVHSPDLLWSKAKYKIRSILGVIGYIFGAIILGTVTNVISMFYGYNLFEFLLNWVKKL